MLQMIHSQNSENKILIVSYSFVASMGRHIFKSLSICIKVKKSRKVQEKIVSGIGHDTFSKKNKETFKNQNRLQTVFF